MEMQSVIERSPRLYDLPFSRWTLQRIGQTISWLAGRCLATVQRTLSRFDLHYKRGRRYVHSPDLEYERKAAAIRIAKQEAEADPEHVVLLYQDELSYYRCPSVERAYAQAGSDAPQARQGTGYTTARRIAGCLDAVSGRLI